MVFLPGCPAYTCRCLQEETARLWPLDATHQAQESCMLQSLSQTARMTERGLLQSGCNVVSPGNKEWWEILFVQWVVLFFFTEGGGWSAAAVWGHHIKQKEGEQGFFLWPAAVKPLHKTLPAAFSDKSKHRFKSRPQCLENGNWKEVGPVQSQSLMVLGRLLLSVHFMVTMVSQQWQPGYFKVNDFEFEGWGWSQVQKFVLHFHLTSPPSSWFSHAHSVQNVSFGGTRVGVKKRQLMRSESVSGGRGVGAVLPNVGFTVSHFNDAHSST